jgi:hypothetical protein
MQISSETFINLSDLTRNTREKYNYISSDIN